MGDINNKNIRNIYSKPYNKNYNLNLNEDNNIRREKNLSSSDFNINIDNTNALKPIKKKVYLNNKKEKTPKINRLADSQEFDNDNNSINSDSSSNISKEFNRTQLLPNAQKSIYIKPFKTFNINNNKINSINNSFENLLTKDNNNKYNTDYIVKSNSDRDLYSSNSAMFKSNKNITHNLDDSFPNNKNYMMTYFNENNNNNLNNTDIGIYQDKNKFKQLIFKIRCAKVNPIVLGAICSDTDNLKVLTNPCKLI